MDYSKREDTICLHIRGLEFELLDKEFKHAEYNSDRNCCLLYFPDNFGTQILVEVSSVHYAIPIKRITHIGKAQEVGLENGIILGINGLENYVRFYSKNNNAVGHKLSVLRHWLLCEVGNPLLKEKEIFDSNDIKQIDELLKKQIKEAESKK